MADQPRRPRTLNDARSEAEAAFKRTTTKVVEAPPKPTALPGVKELVSLRIDQDVLEHFQERRPGLAGPHQRRAAQGCREVSRSGSERRPNEKAREMIPGFRRVHSYRRLAQHAADHAADEGAGVRTAAIVSHRRRRRHLRHRCGAGEGGRAVFIAGARGRLRGGDDFRQQRLVLQLVEEARRRIAAGGLPARDHGAGLFVELAGHLGVEAEPGQAALHVAALALVEADLVLGGLVGGFVEGGGIDAGGQVAGGGARTVLERGEAGQRQRLELAVGIAAEIGVQLFRLVGVLDRAPEFDLDVAIPAPRQPQQARRPAQLRWRSAGAGAPFR